MTKTFIVILNFNNGKVVFGCLDSLKNEDATVIVVDNGSTDGSINQIKNLKLKMKNYKSKLKIIENHKNLGFAKGCNVGISFALKHGAEAVLLLNPDTVVEKGFLKPILENPADIVAPVIKFKRGGEWVYDFGGRVNWWLGRSYHLETKNEKLKMKNDNGKLKMIDYVSGCAVLIKKPVFEKIGLLDERYFLYEEDVDFCLKARKASFKVAVEPKSIVIHKLSEGRKKPLKQHFYHLKSNFIFINRWIPIHKKPLAYLYLLVLLIKVIVGRVV